jgi:hypothetical protein
MLSKSYYRLATAELHLGDPAAGGHYRESLRLREALAKADPTNASHKIGRMLALARCGDHAEAARAAADLGRPESGDPSILFGAACGYALCVAGVTQGKSPDALTAEDRKVQDGYAAAAVELLTRAVALGYKDLVALEIDPDLLPLHEYPAYRQLLDRVRTDPSRAAEAGR